MYRYSLVFKLNQEFWKVIGIVALLEPVLKRQEIKGVFKNLGFKMLNYLKKPCPLSFEKHIQRSLKGPLVY